MLRFSSKIGESRANAGGRGLKRDEKSFGRNRKFCRIEEKRKTYNDGYGPNFDGATATLDGSGGAAQFGG